MSTTGTALGFLVNSNNMTVHLAGRFQLSAYVGHTAHHRTVIAEITAHDLSECLCTYSVCNSWWEESRRYFLAAATSRPFPMHIVWNRVPNSSFLTFIHDLLSSYFCLSVDLYVWPLVLPSIHPSIHFLIYLSTYVYMCRYVWELFRK
jgi:hypothetical protein